MAFGFDIWDLISFTLFDTEKKLTWTERYYGMALGFFILFIADCLFRDLVKIGPKRLFLCFCFFTWASIVTAGLALLSFYFALS